MERQWQKQPLRRRRSGLEGLHELLVKNPLMRGVLIDQNQAVFVLESDVGAPQLKKLGNRLGRSRNLGDRPLRGVFLAFAGFSGLLEQRRIPIDRAPQNLSARIRRLDRWTEAKGGSAKAERSRTVEVAECAPHGGLHSALDGPSIPEPDFRLRRVYVDVDRIGRNSDVEEERWPHAGYDRRAECRLHGAGDSRVAHCSPVDREKGSPCRGAHIRWPLNEATRVNGTRDVVAVDPAFGVSTPPNGAKSRANARNRRQSQSGLSIVRDVDANARLGERERREGFDGAPPFRSCAAQKLEPRRYVVDKLPNRDSRPAPPRNTHCWSDLTTCHPYRAPLAVGRCRLDLEVRYRSDGRQRLSPKAKGRDTHEI